MKEIWKEIKGYEGYYEVSNRGRVRSLDRVRIIKGKVLKQMDNGSGYKKVTLCKNGKYTQRYVHRLIGKGFLKNKKNKETINHKDGNKSNNDIKNLEWATYKENERHKLLNFGNKITLRHAQEIKKKYKTGSYTQKQLANEYGLDQTYISKITLNRAWDY
jgi:hypothetical protein